MVARFASFIALWVMLQTFVANLVSSVKALLTAYEGGVVQLTKEVFVSPWAMFAAHTFAATLSLWLFVQALRFLLSKDPAKPPTKEK